MAANYLRRLGDKFSPNITRALVNLWPPFLAMGIRVEKNLNNNFRHLEISMKMHWYNINYVGVHFGGGIYTMTDAFYMLMLMKNLGSDYIVWDKAASINFKKPGLGTLHATFIFTEEEIEKVRQQADTNPKYIFDKAVDVLNEQDEVIASCIRTLYVRRKDKTPLISLTQ